MKALVLSGGGSRGSWQVGALKYLATLPDFATGFDFISGTSVGAINAVGLAMFPAIEFADATTGLEHLWKTRVRHTKDIWKHRFPPYIVGLWKPSIGRADALDALLREEIDVEAIVRSGIHLRLPSVDLLTGTLQTHTETSKDLVASVMASASFPLVFPPVTDFDRFEIDGGLMDFAPLQAAIDSGADEIWVITTQSVKNTRAVKASELDSAVQVALRMVEVIVQDVYRNDLKVASLYNRLITAGVDCGDKRYIKIHLLEPIQPLGDPLDFSAQTVDRQIESGYNDAETLLSQGLTQLT